MQYRSSLSLFGLMLACSPVVETDPNFDAAYGSGAAQGFVTGGSAPTFGTGGGFGTGGAPQATGGVPGATGGTPPVVGATGGAPAATGGMVGATGGAVGNTGGTVDPGNCPTANAAFGVAGGYVTSGQWAGYAYTWVGENGTTDDALLPASFTDELCAAGTLGMSYDAVAGIGISVSQASMGVDPPKALWNTACASGVTYNVTNNGDTELRVQLNLAGGTSYCAKITAAAGTLVWSQFNSACWDNSGDAWPAGASIESINVTAPGTISSVLSPDFCINSIGHY